MTKKKRTRNQQTGGAAFLRSKGLKGFLVPLTPEVRELLRQAAAAKGLASAAFAGQVIEQSARAVLKK